MMLVEHDVETELVAQLILVVIAVEQIGGDVRIAFAVRQNNAQRAGMIVPGRVIGLFGELIDSHGAHSLPSRSMLSFVPGEGQNALGENFAAAPDAGNARRASIGSNRAPGIIAQ